MLRKPLKHKFTEYTEEEWLEEVRASIQEIKTNKHP